MICLFGAHLFRRHAIAGCRIFCAGLMRQILKSMSAYCAERYGLYEMEASREFWLKLHQPTCMWGHDGRASCTIVSCLEGCPAFEALQHAPYSGSRRGNAFVHAS